MTGNRAITRYALPSRYTDAAPRRGVSPSDKPLYVLGLGRTHCATACLLRDGEIIACASEERFDRIKNSEVFPRRATQYVLKAAGITVDDLDLIVYPYAALDVLTQYRGVDEQSGWSPIAAAANRVAYHVSALEGPLQWAYYRLYHDMIPRLFHPQQPSMYEEPERELGIDRSSITAADHHTCHGYAAYYGFARNRGVPVLVLTHDAEGDGLSAVVSIAQDGTYKRLVASPSRHSLATLYGIITQYLGMRRNEHEYKVMGLAPYASDYEVAKVLPALEELIWVDPETLRFHSKYGSGVFPLYVQDRLAGHRFDGIAGALQRLTENLMVSWIAAAITKTGVSRVALGGGLFMNVKGNKAIMEIPEVDELFPCPSAGDESTAIGAAYWGYKELCSALGRPFEPQPLETLYLGPEFSTVEIEQALDKLGGGLLVTKCSDIEGQVAGLLAQGQIVARLDGRMEWGARALGNRSILANPSDLHVVRTLNDQIKSRDFWMPFAATILKEREPDYIVNPKHVAASFMTLAFDTTPLGHEHLRAAIHPYDYTCRPQVLEQQQNPSYYRIIKEFEARTGIGAVLNTSFNLHGEPIVCTPEDALSTLLRSGLQYLAMGPYLVAKQSARAD